MERGFPVKSSVQTARVLICLLKNCFTDVMNRLNVEFTRHAGKFSHTLTCSDFVDVRCRERSGILLRGPDRKKPDRLAANQSARFARIPDRQKIKCVTLCFTSHRPHEGCAQRPRLPARSIPLRCSASLPPVPAPDWHNDRSPRLRFDA